MATCVEVKSGKAAHLSTRTGCLVLLWSRVCPGAASTMPHALLQAGPCCQHCWEGAGARQRADHSDSPLPPVPLLGKVTHRISSHPCLRQGSARPAGPALSW